MMKGIRVNQHADAAVLFGDYLRNYFPVENIFDC
jgi:hypothetical protein